MGDLTEGGTLVYSIEAARNAVGAGTHHVEIAPLTERGATEREPASPAVARQLRARSVSSDCRGIAGASPAVTQAVPPHELFDGLTRVTRGRTLLIRTPGVVRPDDHERGEHAPEHTLRTKRSRVGGTRREATGDDHGPKSFIWMSGIRIAKAMKPTEPPMRTIIIGSRRLVSACTRVSTWVS